MNFSPIELAISQTLENLERAIGRSRPGDRLTVIPPSPLTESHHTDFYRSLGGLVSFAESRGLEVVLRCDEDHKESS